MFLEPQIRKSIAGLGEENNHLYVHKSGPATAVYLARHLQKQGRNVVIVVPTGQDLGSYARLAEIFARDGLRTDRFWESTWHVFPESDSSKRVKWAKIWSGLLGMITNSACVSVIPSNFLLHYLPPKKLVENTFLLLLRGEEAEPEKIMSRAVDWGYERRSTVAETGEVALRGDILDIFPPGYDHPVRLEFFGDNLESIRTFEALTQRSRQELDECLILPVSGCILEDALMAEYNQKVGHLKATGEISSDTLFALSELLKAKPGDFPVSLFYKNPGTWSEFIAEDACFILVDTTEIRTGLEEEEWKLTRWAKEQGYPVSQALQPSVRARTVWQGREQVIFEKLVMGQRSKGIDLGEKRIRSFSDLFWKPEETRRPWHTFVEALKQWKHTQNQVILSFNTQASRNKFLKIIAQENIEISRTYDPDRKGIYAVVAEIGTGWELEWNHLLILGEDVIQPGKRHSIRPGAGKFAGITSVDEIIPDDLVVHRDYGLGRFGGLKRVSAGKSVNDYLLIYYANEDILYIPADRFSLVQKYKGPEGVSPSLDKLGGTGWSKTKDRVRKAIEKIARDLVDMYAYRKVTKGYSYGPAGELFREFEATFGFDETPDQEQAISDVMQDMERPQPMDRLICGDVGFGKTEVAMRAAFRAVQDGKQVAILCPTTILAEQHYQNFRQRMEDLSVNVRMLSRFIPKARQKVIIEAAKRGEVDIIIGTHRILSKDVQLPRLSLLILDEEQRFGVKHKEKLKKFRQNIDVLTLTATPIPRTLQLSLSGIRTLSIIETPPVDRKPVESSLIERDNDFLKKVIYRELEREGQIFWVFNRIQGLDEVLRYVQELAPEARVAMAHGRMAERDLEETMHKFWHHELDVLVTTAIIESGLDFPRANTLIVDQAHMFGLGQLYQLRGRVGRSERQAYAYFMVPSFEGLSEQARKRMQIILDMDYLGAGFQVAMEDLRLRGAGNLLGEVQSGQIGRVGLDLFLDMLQEEVSRQKGEPVDREIELEVTIGFEAFIPETYISDSSERLKYYRVLSACRDSQCIDQAAQGLRDRFGKIPDELHNFLNVLKIKHLLKPLGISRADFQAGKFILEWSDQIHKISPEKLVDWIERNKTGARLIPPSKLELRLSDNISIDESLKETSEVAADLVRCLTDDPETEKHAQLHG
ncbi:transcription-repair coupling factor [Desulfonatronovibrio hydrogenovorans]|uniref:transcription-repair coupling factor n=1 Tax=Desulfonatronovibrio hydrogenovorans TaxID=53245 RepID=UPI0009FC84BF|nr:transcription-repair coupling factor [Desulfonatronovibrio hydrogenovorans]